MTEKKIIYRGAEAEIIKTVYMKRDVVLKKRVKKKYRIKEIDNQLICMRTKAEAKLISEARNSGVCVPIIYDIDLESGVIIMEYLKGSRIKDIFNDLKESDRKKLCIKIGENIAFLHNHDIIHGDITTSNMIQVDKRIHFIDFGLGEINNELETRGVDLHVLMEAIESTHSKYSDYFKYVLQGYKNKYNGDSNVVFDKIDDIIRRGRYR